MSLQQPYLPLPGKKAVPLAAASQPAALGRSFPCSFLGVQSRMASHAAATPAASRPAPLSLRLAARRSCSRGPATGAGSSASGPASSPEQRARRSGTACSAATASSSKAGSNGTQTDKSDRLSLDNIRASLIRQEDSIIFGLIERAQYSINAAVYQPGGVDVPCFHPDGTRASMLEFMLRENEQTGGKIRRYTSPDEHAFYPDSLPLLVIPAMSYPNPLAPAAEGININARIMDMYVNDLLPALCQEGDDFNYGSTGLADVSNLQCLSKRIHYGKFVAESSSGQAEEFTERHRGAGRRGGDGSADVQRRTGSCGGCLAATYGQDTPAPSDLGLGIRRTSSEGCAGAGG